MFGTQSFLDKSMNGIKVIFDGAGAVISNGSATFNTINVSTLTADNLEDCNLKNCTADDPTDPEDVSNKKYIDDNFVTLATEQNNISGSKTFTGTIKSHNYDTDIATNPLNIGQSNTTGEIRIGRSQTSGGKIAMGTGFSETIIYGSIKLHATTIEDGSVFKSRIIESSAPLSAHHKLFNDMGINAVLTIGNVLSSNVINGNTTFNNQLISNNITSPSVTGTNNIYTNLSLDGGIVNVGARGSNINIKCNLNIVESVYGNTTKITTINQEGNSCRFTNNGSTNGDFIFTINEGSTYNTLVINKTSVDVAGDALIDGNLILYDTTPSSTKNVIIGMVGNDLFFTPYLNVPSSTYNFKVSDSASTITTPLKISSTNTTIANNLICSGTASVTGVLTANGDLKTTNIIPITGNEQHEIYYNNLTTGGTIFFGTTGRVLNIFGQVVMNNTCQFTNAVQANDISFASGQSGSAKTIWNTLTTGGSITIGANTANTTTNIRGGAISIGGSVNNLTIESPTRFNTKINFYSGTTNYTEVLQTGAQLTIKPVHDNGTIALFSTNSSGTQTQQLLINNTAVSSPRIEATNLFSTNYNSLTGFMTIGASSETGNILIGSNLTTGNVNIGNATAGSFKTNIRGSLFSTGQATFQNFCPKSETNPSVANDLVKLSYLQNNFCDRSTTQIIGGEKTFTGNTIIGSALYFTDLDDTSSLDIPNINNYDKTLYFLANNNYDNRFEFWCALNPQLSISQYSTEIKNDLIAYEEATFSKQATFSEDIKHRETQIINKVKTISTTSPAAFEFPLEQRWMFTSTSSTQINVTLPELTLSSEAGFDFSFFKTGSVTNEVLFTCQGTNKIRGLNSITDLTSDTRISGTGTTGGFYTAEVSTGNFVWISY